MSSKRKDDHVRLAAEQYFGGPRRNGFDDVSFVHHALAGINEHSVDLGVDVAGTQWASPIYINAMTGGSLATESINRDLAIAARETDTPIASGSVSAALSDPTVAGTFAVIREENPDGFVMANIGVERSPDDARRAIDLLRADALQVHLNAVQETVMPEGHRAFGRWERSLTALLGAVDVPIIVKEVGFGLSTRTLSELGALEVAYADVSGAGGTDFARIENARRSRGDFAFLTGWGQSTVECLLDMPENAPIVLASGGVRSPLDVVRALALGARAVGVSGPFLKTVLDEGSEGLIGRIREWIEQTRALLALLGADSPSALVATDLIVRGATAEYCRARGTDITALSRRSMASLDHSAERTPDDH